MHRRLASLLALSLGCAATGQGAEPSVDAAAADVPLFAPADAPRVASDLPDVMDAPALDRVAIDVPPDMPPRDLPTADAPELGAPDAPFGDVAATDVTSPCPSGQVLCGGVCTLLGIDPRHCGACGQACAASERCEAGVCRVSCPLGQQACMGADGASVCATLATDRAHCGACGSACPAGQVCTAGRCMAVCASGEVLCTGADASTCADLQRDASHCGMCGRRCSGAERCDAGRCVSRCVSPEVACDGECVNTSFSDAHCGGCGRRCVDGQTCVMGACRPRCAAPAVLCGDTCDDITSSPRNCGVCGAACPAGQSCDLGRCTLVCPPGQVVCNGRCVELQSDRQNCGACGNVCGSGAVCLRGLCTLSCGGGLVSCNGACVDTRSSVANCGACGNACETRVGATAACNLGRCAWTCQAGSGDCDGVATNGCESSLSSTTHCGVCGNACRVTGSGIARCSAGACGVLCGAGTADCDRNYANGCEVDTRTSVQHCGACNRPCAAGTTCVAGVCSAATQVIEGWDVTSWPRAPWVAVGGGSAGTRSTTCARDGAAGLQDPAWIYRTDVSIGAAGERLSLWVRRGGTTGGRAYLGFGASASGGYSLVAGFNTDDLMIQQNSGWGYTTVAQTAWTGSVNTWYRLELTFGSAGAVTGRIYSATNTVLATVTATLPSLTRGGVALRAFGTTCVDTLERR